jgi:hypothetical protein
VPPTPATHWENVLAELQANAPGVQGPVRRVADADAEFETEVTVIAVLPNIEDVMLNAERVVDCEMSIEVVFEKAGNCEEGENELLGDVLENIGCHEEDVGENTVVVVTVATPVTAEVEMFVIATKREDGVRLANTVFVIVTTSVILNVEVNCTGTVGVVALGESAEAIVDVVFAYGPGVIVADGMVVLRAVLFGADPEPTNPVPLRGG